MYNGFYRTPPSPPPPARPPPPDLTPERQPTMSQPWATSSYIQRSTDPSRRGDIPPPISRLPSSIVTDRLNWRHHEQSQQGTHGIVNPGEFYARMPGVPVGEPSYGDIQPMEGLNMNQSIDSAGFYSFAVSSNVTTPPTATFTHIQSAIQPHATPTEYYNNGYFSTPVPPLPPKPFSVSPHLNSLALKPIPIPPPPIPPKVLQSPPSSLHELSGSSHPSTPPTELPEYSDDASGNTPYPLPPEKGHLPYDDEQHGEQLRQAILASQDSHRAAELRNQQLLLQHMSTADSDRGNELIVRESADEDFEHLPSASSVLPSTTDMSQTNNDSTSLEDELIRRATQLSLMEAEAAAARSKQSSVGTTDEDGWEAYDPRAFGEAPQQDMFMSPTESSSASPLPSLATPLPPTIHRPSAVLPSPPQSPPPGRHLPVTQPIPAPQAEAPRTTTPTPVSGPDPELFLAPPPYTSATASRSAPSSPPTQARPELISSNSAPATSPTQSNRNPSPSSPDHSTPDRPGPVFSRSRTYQPPNTPRIAQPWNASADNGSSPPALVGRDRPLRTSASHGNLGASARAQAQDFPAPPVPPFPAPRAPTTSFSAVEDAKAPSRPSEARSYSEKSLASKPPTSPLPVSAPSEAHASQANLDQEALQTPTRGRSKSQVPPEHRPEWTEDSKRRLTTSSSSRVDATGSPSESARRPPPSSFMSYLGDLMAGVSFGFGPASLLPKNQVPDAAHPFPDEIPLRCSDAFFIAAPTFRQLLRLLANLGHVVIEEELDTQPTLERSPAHLRPALQLVQVSPPEEPYIILWLELEVPLPNGMHCNGDTSLRAYRSVLPQNVQHVPNRGSHLFVCQTPLPPLPRKLPEVATYLQSRVVTSRQMADTTGLRRLSKLVDRFYPNDGDMNGAMEAPAKKIGGIFSKVMLGKRAAKRAGKAGADVNDESYDLVTPFRLDT